MRLSAKAGSSGGPAHEIGSCTVSSSVPSRNVASTATLGIISGTPFPGETRRDVHQQLLLFVR